MKSNCSFQLLVGLIIGFGFLLGGTPLAAETDAELISRYEPIWKTAFQKQNGFTDEEFQRNISVTEKSIMHCNTQKYLYLKYVQKIEWLDMPCCDQLLIYISSKETGYRHIPLPRDVFFSASDMDLAVQKQVDAVTLTRFQKTGRLAYPSLQAAKDEVKKKTGITLFLNEETNFYVPGKLPRVDGDPYFIFSGTMEPANSNSPIPQNPTGGSLDGRGIVPPNLKNQTGSQQRGGGISSSPIARKVPQPANENARVDPQPQKPGSCEDPSLTKHEKPIPPGGDNEVMGICAPGPGDAMASRTCIKGYLNLITKKMESWEDAAVNY